MPDFLRPEIFPLNIFEAPWATMMHSISFETSEKGRFYQALKRVTAIVKYFITIQTTPLLLHKEAFVLGMSMAY